MPIPTMPTAITTPTEREFKISPLVAGRFTKGPKIWLVEPHKSRAQEILRLVSAIHSTPESPCKYELMAICICGHDLKTFEILGGFNTSKPGVETVPCPSCKKLVHPFVVFEQGKMVLKERFWGTEDIKMKLPEYQSMKPREILARNPALGHSAIVHYGVLSNAFRDCGIRRRELRLGSHELKKLEPFLGRLPVGIIAGIAGIKKSTVIRMHDEHSIPQCPDGMPPPSD